VVEAVEGPIALNRCLVSRQACRDAPNCPLRDVLEEAQEAMARILESATIADLARHHPSAASHQPPARKPRPCPSSR
jgi:DNA-binding IscR family transcriptional regulator